MPWFKSSTARTVAESFIIILAVEAALALFWFIIQAAVIDNPTTRDWGYLGLAVVAALGGLWFVGRRLHVRPVDPVVEGLDATSETDVSPGTWSDMHLDRMLRDWAYDEGYFIGKGSPTTEGESFRFVTRREWVINIFGTPGVINTRIQWIVGKVYETQIGALTQVQKQELIERLNMELGRHGIDFVVANDLSTIILTSRISHDDALTRFAFIEHLFFVHRARLLAGQTVAQFLRVPPPTIDTEDSQTEGGE